MTVTLRDAGPDDAQALSALVQRSFAALAAADWTPDAQAVFLAESAPEPMRARLRSAVYAAAAFDDGAQPVGVIVLPAPALLGMLFVDPARLREGIGRRLWEGARAFVEAHHPDVRTIELNATPYALRFYRRLGFAPISAPFERGGCRATRLACWLPARALGAELIDAPAAGGTGSIGFEPASADDFEDLVALRIAAMRESLERIGRFDPQRARERFRAGFVPADTRHVTAGGERVGFVVVKHRPDALLLDHLYIRPGRQGRGIGAAVLAEVFAQADAAALPVRVGALRGSDSNRFYARHGFALVEQAEFDNHYLRPARGAR